MNFGEHVALVREFLARRSHITGQIDSRVLNARARGESVAETLESCFFSQPGLPRNLSGLKGQLAASHVADGFEPIALERSDHDFDPAQLAARARLHWDRYRWPGRNVRLRYAAMLYSVFVLRHLERLCLRIWDEGHDEATDRLHEIQVLLDRLNDDTSADALVRDARWLMQTAQGPLTRRLDPYFRIAESISTSFPAATRLEIHKAGAMLTGTHLRSQLCHRASEIDRPADEPGVLAITRNSNSMDAALLVRDLVPLLEAYEAAGSGRLDLAGAIFQAVSADPELFLTRLDLLAPCTTIEHLFIRCGEDGRYRHTPLGDAQRHLVDRYADLIGRHAASLQQDAAGLDPRLHVYSPLGLISGFCADVLSNMALDALLSRPSSGLGLEEMFDWSGSLENKRARADGWKTLDEKERVRNPVDYSGAWAAQMFDRTMTALRARVEHPHRANASAIRDARLYVIAETDTSEPPSSLSLPDGIAPAQEHCLSSDLQRALATGGTAFPRGQIVNDRNEGRFLASAQSGGKWFGISKVVLTVCTSQGTDALLTGVPPPVVDALHLTCPGLVVTS
jgi:hypothetical protein